MEWDLTGVDRPYAYRMLASVVVPRPIAFVTSVDTDGLVNAAPFSFFNLLASDPPVVGVSVGLSPTGNVKDTATNVAASGEFVVNVVDYALRERMNICAIDFPHEISEIDQCGLTLIPSRIVAAPRIAESPAHLECRLIQTIDLGSNRLLLGEVVYLHIADDKLDGPNRVSGERLDLIGRMQGGGGYVRAGAAQFELPRIPVSDWDTNTRCRRTGEN